MAELAQCPGFGNLEGRCQERVVLENEYCAGCDAQFEEQQTRAKPQRCLGFGPLEGECGTRIAACEVLCESCRALQAMEGETGSEACVRESPAPAAHRPQPDG